jgi:hypothetical protein
MKAWRPMSLSLCVNNLACFQYSVSKSFVDPDSMGSLDPDRDLDPGGQKSPTKIEKFKIKFLAVFSFNFVHQNFVSGSVLI